MNYKRITAALLAAFASSASAAVIDFADRPLAANTFDNGGPTPNSNGFVTGNARLNNNYSNDFGPYWNGFSLSNVADDTTAGYGNQYAAYAGSGFGGSGTYAVGFEDSFAGVQPTIDLPAGQRPTSIRVTNTTYTGLSMKNGDGFAKKFGGATGNDADFYSVTFAGHTGTGGVGTTTGSVTFFLADYRAADNAQDYIVKDWQSVDLTALGSPRSITLSFASSDIGAFGINTPTYAAIDSLAIIPEPTTLAAIALPLLGLRRRR